MLGDERYRSIDGAIQFHHNHLFHRTVAPNVTMLSMSHRGQFRNLLIERIFFECCDLGVHQTTESYPQLLTEQAAKLATRLSTARAG